MMKRTICVLLGVIFMTSCAFADGGRTGLTVVASEEARSKLLGAHHLSIQWISWDYFGTATASEMDGLITLKGEQRSKTGSDFISIDGVVTEINKASFKFNGSIVSKVSFIAGGISCVRQGDLTFKISGARKYWRLQEMSNPCDGVTDYVDIYFRK